MKFIVNKSALEAALNVAGKVMSGKNTLPILDCYLFSIADNVLAITGSNLETYIVKKIDIEGEPFTAKIAVPAGQIDDWLKNLPTTPIQITIDGHKLLLQHGDGNSEGACEVCLENADDFPKEPQPSDLTLTINSDHLTDGTERCLDLCSKNELIPALCGLHLVIAAGQMTLTGTNAKVLGTYSYPCDADLEKSLVIPAKAMGFIKDLCTLEPVTFKLDSTHLQAVVNESTIVGTRLIDEKYPDIDAVIPVSNEKELTVQRAALISAINRLVPFADANQTTLRLDISQDALKITTESYEAGTAREVVPHEYVGDPITIGLNGKMLLTTLKKMSDGPIYLRMSRPNVAPVLRDVREIENHKQNLMMIMPLALNDFNQ